MQFKQFQREDIARMALHDGCINGMDTGLGKGLVAYVWPCLKVGLLRNDQGKPVHPLTPAEPVLFVASGDLHGQILREGRKHFGAEPTPIDSQETFLKLSRLDGRGRRVLPPGFYLTTYTQLARNGVEPFPKFDRAEPAALKELLGITDTRIREYFDNRIGRLQKFYARLGVTPESTLSQTMSQWLKRRKAAANEYVRVDLDEAWYNLKEFAPAKAPQRGCAATLADLAPDQRAAVIGHLCREAHAECALNIGVTKYYPQTNTRFKCVWSPSLADLCSGSFAVLVADEAVKIKAEDSSLGKGVRQMNAKYRLPMTGTPIKNRLPDIFRLAHYATGGHQNASPRFPYGDEDAEAFADAFCISERNKSKEERSQQNNRNRRYVRRTPQVCNVHLLWKLLAPIVLRRRKHDCGESFVQKLRQIVRVPMGKYQAEVYGYHLHGQYVDANNQPAIVAKLQALRVAAANPASPLLHYIKAESGAPPNRSQMFCSPHSYTPKVAGALALIKQILERGEQVMVGSAFHDSLDVLSGYLSEAGVRHLLLDGRTNPTKRAKLAAQFQRGPYGSPQGPPVLLAGVESMAEGHSFELCNNAILLAYSWAWDKWEQFINRVHRLTSRKDVNIYPVICEGSIDRKLESLNLEKGDATELVLDGHLLGENPEEVNLADLLQVAQAEFATGTAWVDERELVKTWPALRAQLAHAMHALAHPRRHPETPRRSTAACRLDPLYADCPLWQQAA